MWSPKTKLLGELPKYLIMIHLTSVPKYPGTLEELAKDLGDLRYDALADFLKLLSEKIEKDGHKDAGRGRAVLAGHLHDCANKLMECKIAIDDAWKHCEPFMK